MKLIKNSLRIFLFIFMLAGFGQARAMLSPSCLMPFAKPLVKAVSSLASSGYDLALKKWRLRDCKDEFDRVCMCVKYGYKDEYTQKDLDDNFVEAANKGEVDKLSLLLSAGANKEAVDRFGSRAIHRAAKDENLDTLSFLLAIRVDKEAADNFGRRAIHLVVKNRKEGLKLLLDAGADREAADNNGKRAIHYAAEYNVEVALKFLLNAGVNKEAADNDGKRAIHYAALSRNIDGLDLLLNAGVDKEAADNNGKRAIHYAALSRIDSVLRWFIEAGVDKEAVDNDGKRAIHHAALSGNNLALMWLLREGVKIDDLLVKDENEEWQFSNLLVLDNISQETRNMLLELFRLAKACDDIVLEIDNNLGLDKHERVVRKIEFIVRKQEELLGNRQLLTALVEDRFDERQNNFLLVLRRMLSIQDLRNN